MRVDVTARRERLAGMRAARQDASRHTGTARAGGGGRRPDAASETGGGQHRIDHLEGHLLGQLPQVPGSEGTRGELPRVSDGLHSG
jgi:hypothetical protein